MTEDDLDRGRPFAPLVLRAVRVDAGARAGAQRTVLVDEPGSGIGDRRSSSSLHRPVGLESSSVVLVPCNGAGLRMLFSQVADDGRVTATIRLDERFSGAPSRMHRGRVARRPDQRLWMPTPLR